MKVALIVAPDDDQRRELAHYCELAGVRALLTTSLFEAMSVLGRAELGAVVFPVGVRVLAARGLCQLAERHHPSAAQFALRVPEVPLDHVHAAFPDPRVRVFTQGEEESLVASIALTLRADSLEEEPEVTHVLPPGIPLSSLDETDSGPSVFTDSLVDTAPHIRPGGPLQPLGEDEALVVDVALLSGDLSATLGVELLMSICVQNFTGRLEVEDLATVYFKGGDPVWATHRDGPAGWLREMRRTGRVKAGTEATAVDEATLVRALEERGLLKGAEAEDARRELVMNAVQRVIDGARGEFTFYEDRRFLESAPQIPLSSFEVVLTRLRRSYDAKEIKRRGEHLKSRVLFPTTALSTVAPRLSHFVGGLDLATLIDGEDSCDDLWKRLGVSRAAGALFVVALVEANLATFDGVPLSATGQFAIPPRPDEDDGDTTRQLIYTSSSDSGPAAA